MFGSRMTLGLGSWPCNIHKAMTMARHAPYRRAAAPALAVLVVLAAFTTPAVGQFLGTRRVASGLNLPMFVTHAPGDPDRLFIAEKNGAIKILDLNTGLINQTPFLTILDTDPEGAGGLQSFAFHGDYATNGKFYVHVTVDNGGTLIDGVTSPFSSHVREYTVSGDPDVANATPTEVLNWVQPRNNHNGGWIGFNPKVNANDPQYLYIMSGDGGKQRDPDNNAQTIVNEPLGKVLRVDVDSDDFPSDPDRNYAIPSGNPFDNIAGDDEIWAYGLRNPWRASFDRQTADLWIGDVGQYSREEIDFQPAASPGGENYAWNRREGFITHLGGQLLPGDVEPVYEYPNGSGASVVGGYVHRGPDSEGLYVFGDTILSQFWAFDPAFPITSVQNIDDQLVPDVGSIDLPVSFGEDFFGNLYIVDHDAINGEVFRIVPVPEPSTLGLVAAGVFFLGLRARHRRR